MTHAGKSISSIMWQFTRFGLMLEIFLSLINVINSIILFCWWCISGTAGNVSTTLLKFYQGHENEQPSFFTL